MTLEWHTSFSPIVQYTAQGDSYSYRVTSYAQGWYEVVQLRQPSGQIVQRMFIANLSGAAARAQVWENDG